MQPSEINRCFRISRPFGKPTQKGGASAGMTLWGIENVIIIVSRAWNIISSGTLEDDFQ